MPIHFAEPPANLESLTNEKSFQTLVVDALRLLGWVVIALEDARVLQVGIPDLLCFRAGRGEMIELKVGKRPLSAGQVRWRERWLPEGTVAHLMRNTADDWTRVMEIMA